MPQFKSYPIVSDAHIAGPKRRSWREVSPLPLSFLGVALASGTFGVVDLRWVPVPALAVAALVAVLATAPLQVLAGLVALAQGDAPGALGALLLGVCWAVTGATFLVPAGEHSSGRGVFLVVACVATAVPVIAGSSRPVIAGVVALSGLRFGVSGVAELTGGSSWLEASGILSLALAVIALAAALLVSGPSG